jgi:hypothetical protein
MDAQNGTLLITGQMSVLLERIPEYAYSQPVSLFHGSTVGQHFRHILEFYTCLLEGYEARYIDYSSRKRNDAISEDPQFARHVLKSVEKAISRLDVLQTLEVESEFSDAHSERPAYRSSTGRELQYAFDHAVHHLAIIRMGLEAHFPEIPVDPDLGVAPSTLKHRREQGVEVE